MQGALGLQRALATLMLLDVSALYEYRLSIVAPRTVRGDRKAERLLAKGHRVLI